MASEDIYANKKKYERIVRTIEDFAIPPDQRIAQLDGRAGGKHYCHNKGNLKHFQTLFRHFEKMDNSYILRNRRIQSMKLLLSCTDLLLDDIESQGNREEIDSIVIRAREYYSTATVSYFIADLKRIWKTLFPVKDAQGRLDETQVPYVVRHLSRKVDKSRQRMREDRLNIKEYLRILDSFSDDIRMQAFISLAYESLGRPQEILGRKIKDVKIADNYATVYLSERGKEGIGILRCIDSYPYILKLLDSHPLRDDPEAYLFVNLGNTNRFRQMKPANVNKKLRERCRLLGIDKTITAYSFKRNGVSDRRLRGDSDKEIQEVARWTTTKQLHTYDIVSQEEAYRATLVKRGLLKPSEHDVHSAPVTKSCPFCHAINQSHNKTCTKCFRLLYREDIKEEIEQTKQEKAYMQEELQSIKDQLAKSQARDALILKILENLGQKNNMDDIISAIKEEGLTDEILSLK